MYITQSWEYLEENLYEIIGEIQQYKNRTY